MRRQVLGEPFGVNIVVDGGWDIANSGCEQAQDVEQPLLQTVHGLDLLKKNNIITTHVC